MLGRGLGFRTAPVGAEPRFVWHYTRQRAAEEIRRGCSFIVSETGTDGSGVYFTDIPPGPDRQRISTALWNRWRPERMQAYVRVPFNAAEMQRSRVPRVWFVPAGDHSLTGLDDLALGIWNGPDWTDPLDVGAWSEQPFDCP